MSTNITEDTPTTTRWETYTEVGHRLGMSVDAVRTMARRQKWPKQRPNTDPHGPVLVEVPPDFRLQRTGAVRDGVQGIVVAIDQLRLELLARVERADAMARAETARAAKAVLEAEQGRAAAEDAAKAALQEVAQLREAEVARKARGRLARLRAAWRGE